MLDLVVHDKAGDRILEGLLEDAGQRLREEGDAGVIAVLKTSAGPAGRPHGCRRTTWLPGAASSAGWPTS